MINTAQKQKIDLHSPKSAQVEELYRLACIKKSFSEMDALEAYVRELLNVPDVRLASSEQIESAIEFLRYGSEREKRTPIALEVIS